MKFFVFLLLVAAVIAAVKYGPDYLESRKEVAVSLDHLSSDLSGDIRFLSLALDGEDPGDPEAKVAGKPLLITLQGNDNLKFDREGNGELQKKDPDRFGSPPSIDLNMMARLPAELTPAGENEVTTLVGLKWGSQFILNYGSDGGPEGLQDACEIVVVDKASGRLITRAMAYGGGPPGQLKRDRGMNEYGDRCDPQVIDFITSVFLPGHQVNSTFKVKKGIVVVDQ